MTTKTVSTRVAIVGRGAKCKGASVVEKSAYISRTTLDSAYYGERFYPKYSEDLVHSEIMLPPHAPREYADRSVLWNAVEQVETHARAQLARTYNLALPNEWSYELAVEVMRDYIRRNFVEKGMCAEFAIHDSVNPKTHQMNLHCHIMLTMRPILEDGSWGDKQKKVYKYDKDGNKIRKPNGRYDCRTVKTTDWDDPDNARKWRKDFAETINEVNQRIGNTQVYWEYRSYKERKLEIRPTIHLGEKMAALERQGIHTQRGDYNREIRFYNLIVDRLQTLEDEMQKQKSKLELAEESVHSNDLDEIRSFLADVRRRKGVMTLPIVSYGYIGKIGNRQRLQRPETAEEFVNAFAIDSFEKLEAVYQDRLQKAERLDGQIKKDRKRLEQLQNILSAHRDYLPYREIHRQSESLTGFAKRRYDREHKADLEQYTQKRKRLFALLPEGAKLTPKAWHRKADEIGNRLQKMESVYAREVNLLATAEVLRHTKKDMERIEQNERGKQRRHIQEKELR